MATFLDVLNDMETLQDRMKNLYKTYGIKPEESSDDSYEEQEQHVPEKLSTKEMVASVKGGKEGKSGGVTKYTDFLKKVNEKMFMKKFYGKGKRTAQSVLYELHKSLSDDGADKDVFMIFLKEINDEILNDESKTHTLTHVMNKVKEFRNSYNWNNPQLAVSKKL